MLDFITTANPEELSRERIQEVIEGLMLRIEMPQSPEQVMHQFGDPAFCLGLMSGLLMVTKHGNLPPVLTDRQSNMELLGLLACVDRNLKESDEV